MLCKEGYVDMTDPKKERVSLEDASGFQLINRLYDMGFRGTLSQGKLKIVLED